MEIFVEIINQGSLGYGKLLGQGVQRYGISVVFLQIADNIQHQRRNKIRFVLNKVEKSLVKQKDFEEMFAQGIFASIPADYSAALLSINKGQAATVAQPKSSLAKGISEMADKIIEVHTGITPIKEKEGKKSLFAKKK